MQRKQHSEHDIFVTSLFSGDAFFELQVVTVVAFDDSFLFLLYVNYRGPPLGESLFPDLGWYEFNVDRAVCVEFPYITHDQLLPPLYTASTFSWTCFMCELCTACSTRKRMIARFPLHVDSAAAGLRHALRTHTTILSVCSAGLDTPHASQADVSG